MKNRVLHDRAFETLERYEVKVARTVLRGGSGSNGTLDVPEEYIEYRIVIRTSVAMNILIHWIKNGKRHAPDELVDILKVLQMSENILVL